MKSSESVISEGGKHLSIVYFNACSLVPKLDELCVLIETYKPHIICIVETWLCSDITDNEVLFLLPWLVGCDQEVGGAVPL